MPIFSPERVTKAFGPVPEGTDAAAWVERTKLCADYLPRIGASVDDARKTIICELVSKLFDSWASRRIDLVKTPNDLRAFSSEMGTYLSMIVMPCLSEVDLNDLEVGAIHLAVAGRKQDWLGQAVERMSTALSESTAKADSNNGSATNQRAAIDAFIAKMAQAGRKVTRKDIWMSASYTDRTEFLRFQRGDAKVTKSAVRNFRRILTMGPDEFIRLLEKKRPAK
jgi:hypothetical protein